VRRGAHPDDGRANLVEITAEGERVVAAVTDHRRDEVTALLAGMAADARLALVDALDALRAAAGEVPARAWSLGWTT
jgi:DNA-binding MarR family transcriptional regulator